jgi:hypothetical protein
MQKTYLRATVKTVIGLLAAAAITAGAAEPLAVRLTPNTTGKPRPEMRVPPIQGQVCQIRGKNCTEMSGDPPRPCLVSLSSCAVQGMQVVPL